MGGRKWQKRKIEGNDQRWEERLKREVGLFQWRGPTKDKQVHTDRRGKERGKGSTGSSHICGGSSTDIATASRPWWFTECLANNPWLISYRMQESVLEQKWSGNLGSKVVSQPIMESREDYQFGGYLSQAVHTARQGGT